MVVSGGGELVRLSGEWDVPLVPVPVSIPEARTALGAMAVPPLVLLESIGLFPGAQQWIDLAVDQLTRRRDELDRAGNVAEVTARRIGRTIPLVHSSQDLGAAAALRWKCQINESAKSPAFWNVHPELCHNEVAGWGQNGDATRQLITLVNLRHDAEHPQVSRRFDLVTEALREVMADVIEVRASGEGDLAQLLDLALVGDVVALHAGRPRGDRPGPRPGGRRDQARPGRRRRLSQRPGGAGPTVGDGSGRPMFRLDDGTVNSDPNSYFSRRRGVWLRP